MIAIFNDSIATLARRQGIDLLDLRLVCTEPEDFAATSPIEPSDGGGRKIARAIHSWLIEER
ncbi:MAG: hypothetical protein RL095_34 [Verrucomicrobiota bacterium]|jgi:hypothetical protein